MPDDNEFNHNFSHIVSSNSDSLLNSESQKNIFSLPSDQKLFFNQRADLSYISSNEYYLPSSISSPTLSGDKTNSSTSSSAFFHESLSTLYLPNFPQFRQLSTTIMSGLNWINQFEFNPSAILQNILTSNPFRRRSSTLSLKNNSFGASTSINNQSSSSYETLTYSQAKFARLLNGTIKLKTLKPSELIELSSFGLVELDNVESGIGHEFHRYENDKPTWCDSCGEFLTTPVMNDAVDNINEAEQNKSATPTTRPKRNSSIVSAPAAVQVEHLMRTYLQCRKCKYVCHLKCHNLIRIDCQPPTTADVNETDHNSSIEQQSISVNPDQKLELDSNNNKNVNRNYINNQTSIVDNGDDQNIPDDQTTAELVNNKSSNEDIFAHTNLNEKVLPDKLNINLENSNNLNESITRDPDNSDDLKTENNESDKEKDNQHSTECGLITPKVILDLKEKILKYNERVRSKGSGLGITLIDEKKFLFRGFLRVYMNLTRPINVISGKRPPSIYDIINEEENNPNNQNQRRTLTSFYMPRDTVKNIHITSDSTSLQVIKAMLKKFKVVDNPQKFALYLRRRFPEEELQKPMSEKEEIITRISDDENNQKELTIKKFLTTVGYDHSLKRLHDYERPLILQLEFDSFAYGSVDIVLQENDNADIAWDAFEIPELNNFLKILEREESEHLEHVKRHYIELKHVLQTLIQYEESKLEKSKQSKTMGTGDNGDDNDTPGNGLPMLIQT